MEFAQPCLSSRVVYSVHDYSWLYPEQPQPRSYEAFKRQRSATWSFLLEKDQAPVWVGEFGDGVTRGQWWKYFIKYVHETGIDFAYWALNGDKYPAGMPVDDIYKSS